MNLFTKLLMAGWAFESQTYHDRLMHMIDRCLMRDAVICRMSRGDQTIEITDCWVYINDKQLSRGNIDGVMEEAT